MELSRRIISIRWWDFLGFFAILTLINLAGLLACGIGVIFTSPLTMCIIYVAFEDIIGGAIRKYSTPETPQNEVPANNDNNISNNE